MKIWTDSGSRRAHLLGALDLDLEHDRAAGARHRSTSERSVP